MRLENANASDVLDRILSAYGFTMQKDLSEKLGIAKSNVASWLQRGQVPGNVIVQCALDTGADVNWLVTGEFENSNLKIRDARLKGKALYDQILASGGKAVLRRMLDAYGFSTQKELSDLLGISTATISTWVRRDFFPGDVVVACALDTGVSLEWLATGKGTASLDHHTSADITDSIVIDKKMLLAGKLEGGMSCSIDKSFLPQNVNLEKLCYVQSGKNGWLVEMGESEISNGVWLLDIDGVLDVYSVSRRPGNKLRISGHDSEFDCATHEVQAKGLIIMTSKIEI
ncbi:phage repressor protein CI [Candidatus Symbiopectobacterium sp. NZEC135]|uniref:phage repressor protein CI n=1 Tax=Candidatus Symbiopectobacterium sp. NZEC135 TaxID=2820471 RepID=UPI0022278FB0|nr:phage repressor protein CI [Candidatus Symbiopectobacterium sp. NZEC135]MCW2479155.1 phage repressor protein CI [Candidatus Symbiopectobacterium sp. NZEC135]